MAKRRRLEVPQAPRGGLEMKSFSGRTAPPVAQVAGQAASLAAAEGVLAEIEAARAEGRLAIRLPLGAVAVDHLVRDRIAADTDAASPRDDDMEALIASIRVHGQRTPIEVVQTGAGGFGLISGWRRLTALCALHAQSGEDRFATVLAVIRSPADAGAAYLAMVEENEIRVGLSYYERARIAALAAARGAFPDSAAAVDALFASGSKAKRSKIRSFLAIHEALGDALRFPAHLPERLGLRLATALRDGHGPALRRALQAPAASPEAEATALLKALAAPPPPAPDPAAPGLILRTSGQGRTARLILSGPGLTPALVARIRALVDATRGDAK